MADIKVLPKSLAELIAAGEVVERPASVIKELVENAIDAGATKITVEVQRGGITYMRVTDDGAGIKHDQVPTAFLRHATSKISNENDLFSIGTLGFRGEALASISSVARVELLTKTADSAFGTRYVIEGGEEKEYEEAGCPEGTTIIVRDLFYNIPARMKFLKKDSVEVMAVTAMMDSLALGNPHIAFKYIKDSKVSMNTTGDGRLHNTIYSVLGRQFASGLIPADSTTDNIRVSGWISKPVNCAATRAGQYFFLNGRLFRSGAVLKALETAYKNSSMIGKFPTGVLNIELPTNLVDVNVHPAKTEVRFTNEKAIFDAVYYAAKNALIKGDERPELTFRSATPKPTETFMRVTAEEYKKMADEKSTPAEKLYKDAMYNGAFEKKTPTMPSAKESEPRFRSNETAAFKQQVEIPKIINEMPMPKPSVQLEKKPFSYLDCFDTGKPILKNEPKEQPSLTIGLADDIELELRYIGEAFKTYVIVEYKSSIYFIDKHAAHERILFEKLKKERTVEPQLLLSPVCVRLARAEHAALIENLEVVKEAGFEIEEFGSTSVLVRSVPIELADDDVMVTVSEIADGLIESGKVESAKLESLYHTVACRAAIKAGNNQSQQELMILAKRVLANKDIMYCPHGRPIAFELKKHELEKQFGRLG